MLRFTFFGKKISIIIAFVFMFTVSRVQATPLDNVTDTQIIHTIQGSDKFFTKRQKGAILFHASPFFQHAGRARDKTGHGAPLGERVGKWNMSGLFFGQQAAPATFAGAVNAETAALNGIAANKYNGIHFANESEFDVANTLFTRALYDAVDVKHEKLGLRGQLSCDFGFGLGISIKGGVVDYKEKPNFGIADAFLTEAGVKGAAATDASSKIVYDNLFAPDKLIKYFKLINLDVTEIRDTCLEDTHMQLYWHFPYEMKEKGELTVTMVPMLAVGAWLPTGKVRDQDRAFSIDTGNGGFYGLTFEGGKSFDYPKLLQASFGAGALVSMSKEYKNYRVPSAAVNAPIKQSGVYPWKTTVGITPGVTWYGNASFKADGFSDALSLYFDYIYTYHQKDSITLRETDVTRRAAFNLGPAKLAEDSNWKTQLLNIGLGYRINQHLSFGGAVQAMIAGVRVFKTTTFMGSMTLTF